MTAQEQLAIQVSGHLHANQHVEGARLIAQFSGIPQKQADDNPLELLNGLLHWALNADRYDLAAKINWGDNIFTAEPYSTKLVWSSLRTSNSMLFLGGSSMSKSYAAGVWLFLDWIRDPDYTAVRVIGPSEEHLKSNLFTHLVTLHKEAALPMPGFIGDLFIGLDRKAQKSSMKGIVVPLGKSGAGKIQGMKRVPRKHPHPLFGKMSRLRIFMDETEKIPMGIWKDVDNVFSQLENDVEGFKILGACNPENPTGPTGVRAEPQEGWEKGFDLEKSERWKSKRGWDVVRLDPFKCENVVTGRTIFPGLITKPALERAILNFGGVNSPSYYTFCRGAFPPQGVTFSVINQSHLTDIFGEFIYQDKPHNVASVDVALQGNNAPKMAVGRFGLAIGVIRPATNEHPNGETILFPRPQWGLQMDQLFSLPNAETVLMAANIKKQCQSLGVDPGWVMLDRTGNGAGVHDLLLANWSPEVRGVNYSEGPTQKKICEEDTNTCEEEFDRVQSELWFALQRYLEFRLVRISPVVDVEKLFPQLTSRLYMPGKVRKVESKPEYKLRGNDSPDEADAFTLLLHAARHASGIAPSMKALGTADSLSAREDEPVPVIIGCTDRLDYL